MWAVGNGVFLLPFELMCMGIYKWGEGRKEIKWEWKEEVFRIDMHEVKLELGRREKERHIEWFVKILISFIFLYIIQIT